MDKVQQTLKLTHVNQVEIGLFQREFYRKNFNNFTPPIPVDNTCWQNLVEMVVKSLPTGMRIDKLERIDDSTKILYVVQFVMRTPNYSQEELLALRRSFNRAGVPGIQFIHYEHNYSKEASTWVFFVPGVDNTIKDVMSELHDAASSWPLFVNPDKDSKQSINESFTYFMESFHLPFIKRG